MRMRWNRSVVWGILALCVGLPAVLLPAAVCSPAAAAFAGPTVAEATDTLTKKGLVKKGSFWLLPDEVKLAENQVALPKLEGKCRELQAKFDELAKTNKAGLNQRRELRKEYEKIQELLKGNVTPQQHNNLVAENNKRVTLLNQLDTVVVELMEKAPASFTTLATDLSAARFDLALAILQIQNTIPSLDEKYQPLKDDPEVKAALAAFGAGTRLGPVKNYSKEPSKTAAAEKLVFGDALPLYQSENKIVYDVIVDDTQLMRVGYSALSQYTMISSTTLEAAGVKIPGDAPQVSFSIDGAMYVCRVARIGKLRVGKFVLEDVEVLATPPGAKQLGPWLGTKTYAQYEVHQEMDDLKFTIRALTGDKRAGAVAATNTPPRPVLKPVKP